ncbi:MAG TPA: hypothetical protein DCG38_11130 [Eubacteriaceae bacterium]|nr:hypothetical protein [Eubacteriaceae bacterium]
MSNISTRYYARTTNEPSKWEEEHKKLSRKAACEGMVLLENNGVLPINPNIKKIALFGNGARNTIKGGTGSGDVNQRTMVSIEQGFEHAGFEICTKSWLDAFDNELKQARMEWVLRIQKMTEENGRDLTMNYLETPFIIPSGPLITRNDVDNSETNTAFYVVSRTSGEGSDRRVTKGDYYLWDVERKNIALLGEYYEHVIVILNVGGVIDTNFISWIGYN